MGDFYEMFFHDAEIISGLPGIVLTKRGQLNGIDIPMCGVPVHAVDGYLEKLIDLDIVLPFANRQKHQSHLKKEVKDHYHSTC